MKPGVAFGDFIISEKPSRFTSDYHYTKGKTMRGFFVPFVLFVSIAILFIRLIYLQLIEGNYYHNLSDSNRIRTTVIHAPRGVIFDRNQNPLVFNIPGFRKTEGDKTILIGREKALSLIAKGSPRGEAGEKKLEVDTLRQYPNGEELAHVLGYIGQISKEELQSSFYQGYNSGDIVGKMGIEQEYEDKLRGVDGKQLVEVDSMGKTVRTLGQTDPTPGTDITVTIDSKLQHAAFSALEGAKKAAVVVTTPDGGVLAMVSKPSFDPNLFTLDQSYKASSSSYQTVTDILSDSENQPFLNRAISGVYPPGSTFKLVNAAAALEDKVIDENFHIVDSGIMQVGAFSFANWYYTQYGKTEGEVNVIKAIKRSNDIFFYKLAELNGIDRLSNMAKRFGLGNRLGIDLENEAKGLVPTEEWKKKTIGEPWYLGDTYHYGIGQGYLLTTPLQVNGWTQAIANAGVLYKPHFIKSTKPEMVSQNFLSEKTVSLIREGMIESCSSGGVAWPLFDFKVKNPKLSIDGKDFSEAPQATTSANFQDYRHVAIACKTGTAQHGGVDTPPHAWITLFAPAYHPQIVVTVLVESSGEGSNVAAPVAKKILEEWFSR